MRPSISHITNGLLLSVVLLSVLHSRAEEPHASTQTPRIGNAGSSAAPSMAQERRAQLVDQSAADGQRHTHRPPALPSEVSSVHFVAGHSVSLPGSVRTLRSVQKMMAAHPEIRTLRIEGHADDVGDPCFNLALSRRRVRSVVRWMLANGVGAERLELLACGRRYAEQASRSLRARAQNRRVELVVSEPSQGVALRDRCDSVEL
jgi:outer membrane protein OmpA-like peptidoglycan-associated protein